jgi:hypothetical protein
LLSSTGRTAAEVKVVHRRKENKRTSPENVDRKESIFGQAQYGFRDTQRGISGLINAVYRFSAQENCILVDELRLL